MVRNAVQVGLAEAAENGFPRFRDVDLGGPADGAKIRQAVAPPPPSMGQGHAENAREGRPGLAQLFFMHQDNVQSQFNDLREGLIKAHERCMSLELELRGDGPSARR